MVEHPHACEGGMVFVRLPDNTVAFGCLAHFPNGEQEPSKGLFLEHAPKPSRQTWIDLTPQKTGIIGLVRWIELDLRQAFYDDDGQTPEVVP